MRTRNVTLRMVRTGGRVYTAPVDAPIPAFWPAPGGCAHIPPAEAEPDRQRHDDGLPNPQAFSAELVNTYPEETAACRTCPQLNPHTCARGTCRRLSGSHNTLVRAVRAGDCPDDRFPPRTGK